MPKECAFSPSVPPYTKGFLHSQRGSACVSPFFRGHGTVRAGCARYLAGGVLIGPADWAGQAGSLGGGLGARGAGRLSLWLRSFQMAPKCAKLRSVQRCTVTVELDRVAMVGCGVRGPGLGQRWLLFFGPCRPCCTCLSSLFASCSLGRWSCARRSGWPWRWAPTLRPPLVPGV